MIRIGKYHLLAALGLVLAYSSLLGMFDALQLDLSLRPKAEVWSAPAAAPSLAIMNADLPETDPPAEQLTNSVHSVQGSTTDILSVPPANPADIQPPTPVTATPTSIPLEISSTPAGPSGKPIPISPQPAESTPVALGEVPDHLIIPAIDLDAPIVPAKIRTIIFRGDPYQQWLAPNYHAAGWHTDSAPLGVIGNTVLSGHHNALGAVFNRLIDLEIGDSIHVYSQSSLFVYQVTNRMIVPEKYQQMDTRMANLQWLLPSHDERLTLITCWPDESNTHRVIIVAAPVKHQYLSTDLQ